MGRFWCCTSLKKLFSFLQQPPVAGSASAIGSLWTPPPTLSVLGFLSVLILHNSCSCRPSYCGFMYAMGLPCPEKPVSLQSQATSVSYYFFFFWPFLPLRSVNIWAEGYNTDVPSKAELSPVLILCRMTAGPCIHWHLLKKEASLMTTESFIKGTKSELRGRFIF